MDALLPMFVLARAPKSRRAAIAKQLVPVALPGSSSLRLTFAAISADRQTKRQSLVEQHMVEEAVRAAGGRIKNAEDLKKFPALSDAFNRLPKEVQDSIFKPPTKSTTNPATKAATTKSATKPAKP